MASPIFFVHADKSPSGIKLNNVNGLNLKYAITSSVNAYAQVMLDNLGSADWEKRYGWQVGVRAGNIFKVQNLNIQAEFNTV